MLFKDMNRYYVDERGIVHFTNPHKKKEAPCPTKSPMQKRTCKT
jgi:hypothetical protein